MIFIVNTRRTRVTTETQRYLYTISNFVADVGGYMGLLLGMSCFTFFKMMSRAYQECSNKKKKCRLVHNVNLYK